MIGPSADVEDARIALACAFFGLFVLLFGLSSLWIRGRIFLTSSVLAMTFGIILGPKVLDVVKLLPDGWEHGTESDRAKEILLWFTRLVLAIQVLSAGVTLPSQYILRPQVWRSLVVLLGPVLLSAVVVTGGIVKMIFGIGWWESMLIGACLAPTDPVLASAVIKGTFAERHVPSYLRNLILLESGINDGAGTPYFLLPLMMLTKPLGVAVKSYFLEGLLWETCFPVVAGLGIGWVFRKALEVSKRREWVDKESGLVYTIALALLTVGLLEYINSNELLSCFFAGTSLNWNGSISTEELHSHFSEGTDMLLDVAVFLTLGTVLPWDAWVGNTTFPLPKLVGFGVLVLVFRRLPSVWVARGWIPMVRTGKEAFFLGHFGPMGIGALYYSLKAAEELPKSNILKQSLFGVISWIVFTSTIVHGVTIPMFLLGSTVHPALHPKFLVKDGEEGEGEDREGWRVMGVVWRGLAKIGLVSLDDEDDEDDEDPGQDDGSSPERRPLLRGRSSTRKASHQTPTDHGRPISRSEFHRIMNDLADPVGEGESDQTNTRRGGQGRLNEKQKEALLGQGSGLEEWDLGLKILVYDEGDVCIITDDVNVATRKIVKHKKRPATSRTPSCA